MVRAITPMHGSADPAIARPARPRRPPPPVGPRRAGVSSRFRGVPLPSPLICVGREERGHPNEGKRAAHGGAARPRAQPGSGGEGARAGAFEASDVGENPERLHCPLLKQAHRGYEGLDELSTPLTRFADESGEPPGAHERASAGAADSLSGTSTESRPG